MLARGFADGGDWVCRRTEYVRWVSILLYFLKSAGYPYFPSSLPQNCSHFPSQGNTKTVSVSKCRLLDFGLHGGASPKVGYWSAAGHPFHLGKWALSASTGSRNLWALGLKMAPLPSLLLIETTQSSAAISSIPGAGERERLPPSKRLMLTTRIHLWISQSWSYLSFILIISAHQPEQINRTNYSIKFNNFNKRLL